MPDFEILWGEWGHIELKSGVDRPYGTFCLYGGTLRPVVQKMYGLYGLKHHIVEISGDVTDAGRTNDKRQTTNKGR